MKESTLRRLLTCTLSLLIGVAAVVALVAVGVPLPKAMTQAMVTMAIVTWVAV